MDGESSAGKRSEQGSSPQPGMGAACPGGPRGAGRCRATWLQRLHGAGLQGGPCGCRHVVPGCVSVHWERRRVRAGSRTVGRKGGWAAGCGGGFVRLSWGAHRGWQRGIGSCSRSSGFWASGWS